jgi:hypothetical protein
MIHMSHKNFYAFTGALIVIASLSYLPAKANASPFDKGQQYFELAIGSGSLLKEDYIIMGIGYGYYLQNGLELGIDFDLWLDGNPGVYQVTPEIKYVFQNKSKIKPYVGTFYRRNYIEGIDDIDAYGYRAGIYWISQGGVYIGYGVTHNKLTDCEESVYLDCSSTYSELSFMVTIN